MIKVNTYLNFSGNAEEAFDFYKSIFGGEFSSFVRFKDMPIEGVNMSSKDGELIMHIALPIGTDVLMASDAPESLGFKVNFGNNSYISIHPESKQEADRLFNALSQDGAVEMPISDQIWGDYYGSFTDKFGVGWMVSFSPPHEK
jgi:PhnB protein